MQFFLSALVAFGLALIGMAIGVLFGKSCLRGTCGGSGAQLDGATPGGCEHCPSCAGHAVRKTSGNGWDNATAESEIVSEPVVGGSRRESTGRNGARLRKNR